MAERLTNQSPTPDAERLVDEPHAGSVSNRRSNEPALGAAAHRPSLTKMPETHNLVDDLVAASRERCATPRIREAGRCHVDFDLAVEAEQARSSYRRGPGRPRNERIMRPLTTTIEVGLRARVDAYAEEHNASFVDVLDQGLRLALDVWEGKVALGDEEANS